MVSELAIIAVLTVAVGFGVQRNAYGRRLARNNQYQQLLGRASLLVHSSPDEETFFAQLCKLICQMEPVRLAWIGRPSADGSVQPLVSCGQSGYLDAIEVSILEGEPAGEGPVGRAWRCGGPVFDAHALRETQNDQWRQAAQRYGLAGVHALPILYRDSVDAILVVYFAKQMLPGIEEQLLLERLAGDLSNGITAMREQLQSHRLAAAIAQVQEAVFILDAQGYITWFNEGCARLFGLDLDSVQGKDPSIVFGDPNFDHLVERLEKLSAGEEGIDWETLQVSQAEYQRWVHVSATRLLDEHARTVGVVVVEVDLTDERAALDAQERLLAILDNTSDGVGITDRNGTLIYLNNGGRQLLGLARDARLEGQHFFDLIHDRAGQDSFLLSVREAAANGRWQGEVTITRPDGSVLPLSMVLMAHRDSVGHVQYLSAIARNIVDFKAREHELSYLAEHDALTGLPNRRALSRHLASAIVRARQSDRSLAVGVIDLDDFKPVNDRYGHHAGDELLVQLAQRLVGLLPADDVIVRLAGDEFVVLLSGLDPVREQMLEELDQVLARLYHAVETPFVLEGTEGISVSMSIGVAVFPDHADDPDGLLRAADAALYLAKQNTDRRERWWTLLSDAGSPSPVPSPMPQMVSAYGVEAAAIIASELTETTTLIANAVAAFYHVVEESSSGKRILGRLSEGEYHTLKQRQAEHLGAILMPELERASLNQAATRVGAIHWLTGLNAAGLVDSMNTYRLALTEALNQTNPSSRGVKQAISVIERRIDDDLAAQLDAMSAISDSYFGIFANPLPTDAGGWIDTVQMELELVGQLRGIAAVALCRQRANDALLVETYSGPSGQEIAQVFNAPGCEITADPTSPNGQLFAAQAWRESRMVVVDDLTLGGLTEEQNQRLVRLGLRTAVALPIQNLAGRPVGLLLVFGTLPGQFSSDWMSRFCINLKQRWENLFYRITTPINVLAREQAIAYRELLLSGGLRMYVQPIIELATGRLAKVEGLARLAHPDGRVVGPESFLSIQGTNERYQLFRLGLEALLAAEQRWRAGGLLLDLTINVDATTLAKPELGNWLREILQRYAFPSERLILELLETDQHPLIANPANLEDLMATGVRLAIDDMGSGYSNWLRLIDIPATTIKIDHNFVARIKRHPRTALNLLGTLILSAIDAGQEVVVEGIEDATLAEVAARLGATYGQGFHIARPMPTDHLLGWADSYEHNNDGELHSLLGAMAYHWAFVHNPRHFRRGPISECPLTRYFERSGLADSIGAALHNELHSFDTPPGELVDRLTDWFERVCVEAINGQPDPAALA